MWLWATTKACIEWFGQCLGRSQEQQDGEDEGAVAANKLMTTGDGGTGTAGGGGGGGGGQAAQGAQGP